MMRRRPLLGLMLLGVAAVVGISLGVLRRGRQSILQEFQVAQGKLAQTATSDLLSYLDSFDRDTRLAAALAERTRSQTTIDRKTQDQVIEAAFAAQVTVVAHYRTIALFGSIERPPVVAVDPTEDPALVAPVLIRTSAPLAQQAMTLGRPSMLGPVSVGADRFFYFYAVPAGPGEAVVVSADASLLLRVAGRGRGGAQTMVVVDPNGATWLGCETKATCQLFLPQSEGHRRIDGLLHSLPRANPSLRLPTEAVIGMAPPTDSALGRWSVSLIASAAEINAREQKLFLQLLLTSAGVIATVLSVGFFIVRQRASAAVLEARLQTAEEIANLRERSERILESVPAGILGVTPDGRVAMVNRFFLERIQQQSSTTSTELPTWTDRLRPHIDRALASKRTQIVTDRDTGVGPASLSDFDVRIIPLDSPADDVAALVLVEDLSELHNLQRQLVRAEKLMTVGVLSAGIAHEVGTPLMVIRGRAEHLLEGVSQGATAEALQAIIAQIDHISATIRQVLEFCRTEPISIGVADARLCVAQAVKLLEWRLTSKHITVRQMVDSSLPLIAADPQQFEQMVINLLINACDASPEGAVIDVVGRFDPTHEDHLRFEVIDRGTGIAPEHMHAAFDPYFTTKKRGEGTGLGLAIVAHIARLHRGEVTLVSAPGAGTTASVLWPLARPERDADA